MTNFQKNIKKYILKDALQLIKNIEFHPMNTNDINDSLSLMKIWANKIKDKRLCNYIENAIDANDEDQIKLLNELRNIQYIIQQEIKLEENYSFNEDEQELKEVEKTELNDFITSRGVETSSPINF